MQRRPGLPNPRLGGLMALLGCVLLAAPTGCTETFQGAACQQDADCPAGQGCDEQASLCRPSCSSAEQCPSGAYRCDNGLCVEVDNPACTSAADCTTPGACESLAEVSCVAGACRYSAVVCDDPPAPECVDDDSTIRTYVATGTCSLQTGQCEYSYVDTACANCSVNCLGNDVCDTVTCPDENGGCKVDGLCVPTSPPTCTYQDAPVNTPCDRPESPPGSLDGFCNQGVCGDLVPVPCAENSACAPGTCIEGFCHPLGSFGEPCDAGDDADCGAGLACGEAGTCLWADGQPCTSDAECVHTCMGTTCAPLSGSGGPCDDLDDCQAALVCVAGTCQENGLARIRIQGSVVSGGGTLAAWHLVDPAGTDLGTVSPDYPLSGLGLWADIDWTADLDVAVAPGSYLAVAGSSGSAALTRTFTFYDGYGVLIDTLVVDSPGGSAQIERDFGHPVDWFVRFYYDGARVTFEQRYPPIHTIRVEGTPTSAGGGGPLTGYFETDLSGANLGQLSSGFGSTLYGLSFWEVTLTRPIYGDMHFVLVGSEGSSDITRTFTFLNADGGVLDSVQLSGLGSDAIVRSSGFPGSGDTFTRFTYQGGAVTAVQQTL